MKAPHRFDISTRRGDSPPTLRPCPPLQTGPGDTVHIAGDDSQCCGAGRSVFDRLRLLE